MQTITAKIPEEALERLNALAESMDRSRSYLVRQAIEHFVAEQEEDAEDLRLALEVLKNSDGRYISREEMVASLGLDL